MGRGPQSGSPGDSPPRREHPGGDPRGCIRVGADISNRTFPASEGALGLRWNRLPTGQRPGPYSSHGAVIPPLGPHPSMRRPPRAVGDCARPWLLGNRLQIRVDCRLCLGRCLALWPTAQRRIPVGPPRCGHTESRRRRGRSSTPMTGTHPRGQLPDVCVPGLADHLLCNLDLLGKHRSRTTGVFKFKFCRSWPSSSIGYCNRPSLRDQAATKPNAGNGKKCTVEETLRCPMAPSPS